ncbi:MAG: hypothetical protein AAGH71_06240 [Planctomycetota bacterium]
MSEFESAVRSVAERFKPALVFAARLADAEEAPEYLHPESSDDDQPWSSWDPKPKAEMLTAVEIAGSQRLTGENADELVTVMAGLRLAYMKIVSDLADQLGIPEGELHNRISEFANNARIAGGEDGDEPDGFRPGPGGTD